MSLDVRFAFVCKKKFSELRGEGQRARFCDDCRRGVINLDPLDDRERLELFEQAQRTGVIPCVAATEPLARSVPCFPAVPMPDLPPMPPMVTAGVPMMPKNLAEERARLDKKR